MLFCILNSAGTALSPDLAVLICFIEALFLGIFLGWLYTHCGRYTKSFVVSISLLPAVVAVVIMLVNGNLGMGVAVLGTFSLVRFRSVPGNAKDICAIFFAMAVGLACGAGYVYLAPVITVVLSLALLALCRLPFGEDADGRQRDLRIVIPESLQYTNAFDDLFERYTKSVTLERAKTTNMGSMFELRYRIILKDIAEEKQLIDELRVRNGNLPISCSRLYREQEEL